ncbi:MAG: hypothetical protein P1P67_04705 [Treponema phagedenis]|uniref:hypothetical protein n=1 Tax=Treponema phagedenis TaxID=162 RepID=UPI0004AD90AA|nr:hypothetical protein [Treponema phagedenis]
MNIHLGDKNTELILTFPMCIVEVFTGCCAEFFSLMLRHDPVPLPAALGEM